MTGLLVTVVTVNNNNSPIQDYVHLNDQTQPTPGVTPGFKPFTGLLELLKLLGGASIGSKFSTNQKHYYPDLGSDASSVWNFCACFSDAICGEQWRRKMSAVFSGYSYLLNISGCILRDDNKYMYLGICLG